MIGNTQYHPGDVLPDGDAAYVESWIAAGSAKRVVDASFDNLAGPGDVDGPGKEPEAEEPEAAAPPKAKPAAAPAGIEGIAYPQTGGEPDLIGKVPSPKARGAVKERGKRPPKNKS